ncbi:DciA family protein [Slackia heliotrinireducens]|uniref:DciA family protein n=1 Tax=Slackia heliotrinireducens TaxID=84110 RepID=UPI003315B706
MARLQPFSQTMGTTMRDLIGSSEAARKAARAAQVKEMWRGLVEPVFLEHTNAVYIIQEENEKVLVVYVDSSIFAAELNARRELIKMELAGKYHEVVDEFRIIISRGPYKNNHPFIEEKPELPTADVEPVPLDEAQIEAIEKQASVIENARLRQALIKAMISDLELKNGIRSQNN